MKLRELIVNKRVLVVPNCSDLKHPKENRNVLTWSVFKMIKLVESQQVRAKSATFNSLHNFDIVIAQYTGKGLDDKESELYKLKSMGHTIVEYYWCQLNSMFLLHRLTYDGQTEFLTYTDSDDSNTVIEKDYILGFKVGYLSGDKPSEIKVVNEPINK